MFILVLCFLVTAIACFRFVPCEELKLQKLKFRRKLSSVKAVATAVANAR